MEASVLSPTSWEKRRAWLRQSRNWQTQVLEEEVTAALQDIPSPEPSNLDDVFQEGNPINKIEDWLQDCGDSEEELAEVTGQCIDNGCYSHETSFEDDLTLGAEATLLNANGKLFSRNFLQTARPGQLLDLGCSLASSSMTGGTNKTSSSISEILDQVQEDAEDVLFSLGFGQDHKDTSRIPARFFTNPSQAKGIDFQLFLKSQVQRIEMEEPCLMLASRFKQVQTLAVTADAFFCLYSYVSKTPVQKFTPSHMFWNYNPTDVPSIKILTPEPEPHSPRERLRKAISKMCLYTGSRDPLSSPSSTPKRNSLDQVVWEVMDRVRGGEKLVFHKGPGFEEGPGENPAPPIGDTKFPASSFPLVLCPKEELLQGTLAKPQTLHWKTDPSCWTQSLNKTESPWSPNPVQARNELCGLQESHSDKNETFWKRKSKARKCLFQKSPLDRKVESLDLSSIKQKWKQIQTRPEMHRSLTQQPQDSFDSEEGKSNSEEEESRWPGKPRQLHFYQTYLGKDSQSLLNQHHNTYPKNNGFPEDPTSHLWQEVVHPCHSNPCPLALETSECTRRPTAWYIKKKTRPRELDSAS
ncbi:PREDICTED: protein TESPA1 [Dipodomys ordii]|uniref:Protein TESPA1 n=1 Tax=Dipodomys ordii TaxID=10020 RepID=A0A1S3FBR3_DIPOR|nr:PREDICTED: protein TESPA1 [Dipodomys ordii]XP_012873395.1 PREDICTED: protein TESPA1 [Dipodomys ordii]XP_012873403.1 PREDICTED: protein TESPA1 [Dipodomys ordii]XP_012873410.1 PREDICTED: protein TESPA1 [Dipodomys ordii]